MTVGPGGLGDRIPALLKRSETATPRRPPPRRRRLVVLLALAACAGAMMLSAGPLAGSAQAPAAQPAGERAGTNAVQDVSVGTRAVRRHRQARRVGGSVRKAWPAIGRRPRARQARWLARQVGAITPRPCARNWRLARARCHPARAGAAAMSVVAGDPGSPAGQLVRIASGSDSGSDGDALPLQLARSYAIPADDPSYNRLLDWAWTYDSAVAAAAFVVSDDKSNAAQLLDQLTALQYTDGSLEIAFNTTTGEGARVFRSGTVAWLGLAAASYDQAFDANRYRDAQQRAADYLLSLQTTSGLIQGGPDVKWVSTQHNLIAYVFLARLANELKAAGKTTTAARYQAAATTIATAINTNLLVADKSGTHFLQGLNDTAQALDVQALGAMYLQGIGQPELAAQVLAYAQATFAVAERSVKESSDEDTYNMTYAAGGPFAGYAPYAGEDAPDVLWAEASGVMRLATAALGQDTGALDKSIAEWAAITPKQGPLQADRTVTSGLLRVPRLARLDRRRLDGALAQRARLLRRAASVRHHAGQQLDQGARRQPHHHLPRRARQHDQRRRRAARARRLDGRRLHRHLQRHPALGRRLRDLRAGDVNAATKLTGYCIQVNRAFGQIVVRALRSDAELQPPLARVNVPAGFAWYGVPHTLGVTVKGNAMNITLDGAQAINVPDLAAASATSVKYSYGVTTSHHPAGGGRLRPAHLGRRVGPPPADDGGSRGIGTRAARV